MIQVLTIVRNGTGEGKDMKTEYQVSGNVSLMEAQQMLTEITIASSKAEAKEEAKKVLAQPKTTIKEAL